MSHTPDAERPDETQRIETQRIETQPFETPDATPDATRETPAPEPEPSQPPASPDPWHQPAPLVSTTPRTGTIVWGFVILAVGLAVLGAAAGLRIDVGLGLIVLLAVAGGVLVVASVVGGLRRRTGS